MKLLERKKDSFVERSLKKSIVDILFLNIIGKRQEIKNFLLCTLCVFYNGVQNYNAPTNLWELFENSELVK
ncbi:transposase, partial [Candidatus Rickettsia tasmanensis]